MKVKIIITIVILLFYTNIFTQNKALYAPYIKEALELYEAKEYLKSAIKYEEAFDQLGGKAYPSDRYNAACSYALAGDTEKSFFHLFSLAENPITKFRDYQKLISDSDLEKLHSEERWDKLITLAKTNKERIEKKYDRPLIAQLDKIHEEDQNYRVKMDTIEKEFGRDSEEMKANFELIKEKDSLNLIEVTKILDTRGWLGSDIIGEKGNSTLFLVIQHSNLETQLKYLPMMREAVKNKNASARSLALLEDRIALRQEKSQIYGSQIGRDLETGTFYVLPLIDPKNVDKRRAEVGLGNLTDYVKNWGVIWDIKTYNENIEKFEGNRNKMVKFH